MDNKRIGKNSLRDTLVGCLLLVAVVVIYAPVFTFDFVTYDDDGYVTMNPTVQRGLQPDTVVWAFTKFGVMGNWHPVTLLSHMLDCQIFGLNPAGHHATSILLHALNCVLLFVVLRRMTSVFWPSVFVAAMFAFHPLRVESVAWIAERKDVLSMFFGLLATLFYVQYTRHGKAWRYLIVGVALALGLMSKPMLVTLPLVFLLLDYWPLGRSNGFFGGFTKTSKQPHLSRAEDPIRQQMSFYWLVLEKVPWIVLSAFSCWATMRCQESGGALEAAQTIALGDRLTNAVIAYSSYLSMLFWPTKLCVMYPHPNLPGGMPWGIFQVSAAWLLIIIITSIVFCLSARRYLLVGWLWYVGTLVPVIGIVQVGFQSMADRYTYFPMIGLLLMIVWSGNDVWTRFSNHRHVQHLLIGGMGCWLVVMACCTWHQIGFWHDSIALYERAVAFEPSCPIMHNNLGIVLVDQNQHWAAVEKYTDAIQRDPEYAEALTNRGNAYRALGKSELALKDYSQAIVLQPKLMAAYYNRGNIYGQLKQFQRAIKDLTKAIQISPEQAKLYEVRGNVYRYSQEYELAIQDFSTAIEIVPDYYDAIVHRGRLELARGNQEQAIRDLTRAMELQPNDAAVYSQRGDAYSQLNRLDLAVADYSRGIELSPQSATPYFQRGILLGQKSDYRGAIRDFTKTIELQSDSANAYYSRGLARKFLKEYRSAVEDFEKAIEIDPDTAKPYDLAAWILATCPVAECRDGRRAVKSAKRACELSGWKQFQFLSTLAAAHAEVGEFPQAVRWQIKATRLVPQEMKQAYRNRLNNFRAGRPIREP